MFDPKFFSVALVFAVGCVGTAGPEDSSGESSHEVPGQVEPPDYLDTDYNSLYDAVDRDLDGLPDYFFAESSVVDTLIDADLCLDPDLLFVDPDGDGIADGLDLNCDGVADVSLVLPDSDGTPPDSDSTPPGGGSTPPDDGGSTPPDDGNTQPPVPAGDECTAFWAVDGDVKRVDCSSDAMGTTCTCYRNDVLVDSCSQPGSATCSVLDGCCDFGD